MYNKCTHFEISSDFIKCVQRWHVYRVRVSYTHVRTFAPDSVQFRRTALQKYFKRVHYEH